MPSALVDRKLGEITNISHGSFSERWTSFWLVSKGMPKENCCIFDMRDTPTTSWQTGTQMDSLSAAKHFEKTTPMQPGRTWASLPRFPLLARVFQWGRSGPTSGSFASLALHPRGLRAICLGTEIGPRYGCSTCKKTCAAHAHLLAAIGLDL